MLRQLIVLAIASCLVAHTALGKSAPNNSALAQSPDTSAEIDRYVRTEMRRQKIPGLSLAIARDGHAVYVKSYGVATLEHPVKTKPDTVYQIGSIGKQFTAVAIMLLARDHKLNLDDPLLKYLPELPASWGQITLRLILNHQSGIAQFTTPSRQLLDLSHDYTDAELIRLAASQPLDFEPGTDVSYSDTGYVLLGFVINRVAGMFYGDYLQQRVFGPLGMTRTRIISDTDIVPDRASGYEMDDAGRIHNQSAVSVALNRTADGSLYSTVLDLLKWDRALYGDAVLPGSVLERMWSVDAHRNGQQPLYHYGYGWENIRLRRQRLIEYDGNWQGFQAVMSRYVDKKLSVIILTNLALCRTERLSHTIAGMIDPSLRAYPIAVRDDDAALTQDFQRFLDETAAGSQDLAELSPSARARLVPSVTNTLRRELYEIGPIQQFTLAGRELIAGRLERTYRVEGKDMVDFFTISYTPDQKIDDLDLLQEF